MKRPALFNLLSTYAALSLLLASSCSVLPSANLAHSNLPRDTSPSSGNDEIHRLVEGNNTFALDLYGALRRQGGNLIFSPYSLSIALAMTYAGARSETSAQMASVLHFDLPTERLYPAFNRLDLDLSQRAKSKSKEEQPLQLNLANAIWAQKSHPFLQEYLDLLAREYGAGVRLADFVNRAEPARREINGWVSDQTQGKIQDLIPEGLLDAITRMVLVNAVYFKAGWEAPFEPNETTDQPFHLLDGSQVQVPMMSGYLSGFLYVKGEGYQAVELPYKGASAAMDLIVPDSGQFQAFETALDAEKVKLILSSLQPASGTVGLPKFKFTGEFKLADSLASLGMPAAFDPTQADFSGMDGARDLYISDVIHKAFISVDEKGTEAAAASAVVMRTLMAPSFQVNLMIDRPFFFLIRDLPSGQILFAGRVLKP